MATKLSRREFLKLSGLTSGGLILAIYLEACAPGAETPTSKVLSSTPEAAPTPTQAPTQTSTPASSSPFDWDSDIYIKLDQDAALTFTAFRSEMGQGIRTALAMIVADELDVEWSNVRIVQADADPRYGDQFTGGSQSISSYYDAMRSAGAKARQYLVVAAANVWNVDPDQCTTEVGFVVHPDGEQKLFYGDLVEAASQLERPKNINRKDPSQFRIIGTGIGHWDAPDIVTGKAVFGIDIRLPDMVFAAIARCPVFGGTLASFDDTAARAIPGLKDVVALGDRVAVVAENSWAAIRGRDALQIVWDEGSNAALDSHEMMAQAVDRLKQGAKDNLLDAYYEFPYEAHATMEPMNCTAHSHDEMCEVWAPTQVPQEVRDAVAHECGLSTDQVVVHVPLMGGGFGRRLQTDYAVEAALLSQSTAAPVQVIWTRADDLQHDFYNPLAVQYASGSLDAPALPAIRTTGGGNAVPTGWWRSVENFSKAFSEQRFIDEMAAALGRDPFDLRLELYNDNSDALNVIKLAAEKSDWGKSLPVGQGRGMAYYATFGRTHVAEVAEVTVSPNGKLHVDRVVCAVKCGTVVNPDTVIAQLQGGIVFGLTAALKAEITIQNGRVEQSNFDDHPILRMDEMPMIQVHIVPSDERPSGIGEMGVPPIAPAVANAIYAVTGKRIRRLPIRAEDLAA
jgi:isoquinoline 1-oxidoreductase beta subunit